MTIIWWSMHLKPLLLTILAKKLHIDILQGREYAFTACSQKQQAEVFCKKRCS